MNEEKEMKLREKKKRTFPNIKMKKETIKKLGVFFFLLLLFVLLVLGIKKVFFQGSRIAYEEFKKTDAFFLPNEKGVYALFNESGKQLTDYEFSSFDTFYGGITRVETEDGKYVLLDQKGKTVGQFSNQYLYRYYSLYKVNDEKKEKEYLLNYRGKSILEDKVLSVNNFSSYALYLVQTLKDIEKKKMRVYDYLGKKIDTLDADNYSISENIMNGYVTLSTAEKTILYNIDKGKKITELEGKYCILDAKGDTVLLSSCAYWNEEDKLKNYKVVKDKKERYTLEKETCLASLTDEGEVLCKDTMGAYHFVHGKGEIGDEEASGYFNSKTYVKVLDNQAIFYESNKERNKVSCLAYSATTLDGYIMQSHSYGDCNEASGYFYYDKKGNKKSDRYLSATVFDENGLAVVSSKSGSYYLINKDFKQVSKEYSRIRSFNGYYLVYENEQYQLLDKNQKVLEKDIRDYTTSSALREEEMFLGLMKENQVVVYNATKKKKVGEASGTRVTLLNHYYVVDKDYYSYQNGKSFYQGK